MRQWTVDAFAAAPFKGNPTCVVEPFDAWPEDGWMQALAAENNQAETAYLVKAADPSRFSLRWFTPAVEVPLCGHATLACAHVLFAELGLQADQIAFETRSGRLTVTRENDLYAMDLPADPPRRTATPEGLAAALGVQPAEVWAGAYLVVVLDSEAAVRSLNPDLAALCRIGDEAGDGPGNVSVAALAEAGSGYDVVSRFFGPACGIPEDPVTGSAHCLLAPLFADRLGRARNRFHQAYPGRGGDLDCEVKAGRVILRGQAVTVVESVLRL